MLKEVEWQCQIDLQQAPPVVTNADGQQVTGWTVGATFPFKCSGETQQLQANLLKVVSLAPGKDGNLEKSDDYRFKLVKIDNVTPTALEGQATSYIPGQHELAGLIFTDGTFVAKIANSLSVEFVSVLPQKSQEDTQSQEQVEQPQITASIGPLYVEPSVWWQVALMGLLVFLLLGVLGNIFRRLRVRQREAALRDLRTHLSSEQQFYKDLRKLESFVGVKDTRDLVQGLDTEFRLYLTRQFLVEARGKTKFKQILNRLAHKHPQVFVAQLSQVSSFYQELQGLQKEAHLDTIDFLAMAKRTRILVENLSAAARRSGQ